MNGSELLGYTFKDRITGFVGIAMGYCEYLSGCNQVLLVPPVTAEGAYRDGQWFDVQRVLLMPAENRITLDNGRAAGDRGAANSAGEPVRHKPADQPGLRRDGIEANSAGEPVRHKPDLWTVVYAVAFLGLADALTAAAGELGRSATGATIGAGGRHG